MTEQPVPPVAETAAAESVEEIVEAWYEPARVLRFVFWMRVAARVFLVLALVGVVLVGWDIFSQARQMPIINLLRTFIGQYLGFASLFMAVAVFEGVAHALEVLMDIAESVRK